MRENGSLRGRSALVTGASGGIGRAVALELAARGAIMTMAGRPSPALSAVAEEIRAGGGNAEELHLDLGQADSARSAIEQASSQRGFDIAVASAGIAGPTATVEQVDLAEWTHTLALNVTGVLATVQGVLPEMKRRRRGSIVVLGSMTGTRPLARRAAYAASKMALVGLVRTVALEVGSSGIRVNLVSPGPVSGDRLDAVVDRHATQRGISASEAVGELFSGAMLPGLTTAQEVASTVAFLASPEANSITGEDINVSRGLIYH